MPTPTYTPLANITLSSTASTVTFSSISSYRDLVLVCDIIPTASLGNIRGRFNSDSTNTYTYVEAVGNGSSASSSSSTDTGISLGYLGSADRTVIVANVLDSIATDKHKTVLTRQSSPGAYVAMRANHWPSTSAITSFAIVAQTSTFAAGSTFALYGIAS